MSSPTETTSSPPLYSYSYSHSHPVARSPHASAFAFDPSGSSFSLATTWKNDVLRHSILDIQPNETPRKETNDRAEISPVTTPNTSHPSMSVNPTFTSASHVSQTEDRASVGSRTSTAPRWAAGESEHGVDNISIPTCASVVSVSSGGSTRSPAVQPSLTGTTKASTRTGSERPLVQLFEERGSWLVERRILQLDMPPVAANLETSEKGITGFYADHEEVMRERARAGYGQNFLQNYSLCACAAAHSQTLLGPLLYDGRKPQEEDTDNTSKLSKQNKWKAYNKDATAANVNACLSAITEDTWGSTDDKLLQFLEDNFNISARNRDDNQSQPTFLVPDKWWGKIAKVSQIRKLRHVWEWLSGLSGTSITLSDTQELLASLCSSGWLMSADDEADRATGATALHAELMSHFEDLGKMKLPLNGQMIENMIDRALSMFRYNSEHLGGTEAGEQKSSESKDRSSPHLVGPVAIGVLANHGLGLNDLAEIEVMRSLCFYCCGWPILPFSPVLTSEGKAKETACMPANLVNFKCPSDSPSFIASAFTGNLARCMENGRWERAVTLCSVSDVFLCQPFLSNALKNISKISEKNTVPAIHSFPSSLYGCSWAARLLKYLSEGVEVGSESSTQGESSLNQVVEEQSFIQEKYDIKAFDVAGHQWWDLRHVYERVSSLLEAFISLSNATFHQASLGYDAHSAIGETGESQYPISFARRLVNKWYDLRQSVKRFLEQLNTLWTYDGASLRHRHPYLLLLLRVVLFALPTFESSTKMKTRRTIPKSVKVEVFHSLADEGLEPLDRVALATTIFPVKTAFTYALEVISSCFCATDIRGIVLNGIPGTCEVLKRKTDSSDSCELLQKFVDQFSDVQTVSLISMVVDPYTISTRAGVLLESWRNTYTSLLNRWKCFHARAGLQKESMKVATRYKAARGHQFDPLWHPFFSATQRRKGKRESTTEGRGGFDLGNRRSCQIQDLENWFTEISEWLQLELITERSQFTEIVRLLHCAMSYMHVRPSLGPDSLISLVSSQIETSVRGNPSEEPSPVDSGDSSPKPLRQRADLSARIREGATAKPKGRSPLSLNTPSTHRPVVPLQQVPAPKSLGSVLPNGYVDKFPSVYSSVETRIKGSFSALRAGCLSPRKEKDDLTTTSDESLIWKSLSVSYVFPSVPMSLYSWSVLTQPVTYAPSQYLRCSFCDKPLALPYLVKNSAASLAWLNNQGPRLRCCPLCRNSLPKCSLSLLPLRLVNPARRIVHKEEDNEYEKQYIESTKLWAELLHRKSPGLLQSLTNQFDSLSGFMNYLERSEKNVSDCLSTAIDKNIDQECQLPAEKRWKFLTQSLHVALEVTADMPCFPIRKSKNTRDGGSRFEDMWVWCVSCRHGGYTENLLEWFAMHEMCPVAGCECHCVLQDMTSCG